MEVQPAADVLQEFLSECEAKLMQFAPQNISNMLWACATLGVSPGRSSLAFLNCPLWHLVRQLIAKTNLAM